MWLILGLLVIGLFVAGLIAGYEFFCGKVKSIEWKDLPAGQYHVMCRCPRRLDDGSYLPSGTYRFLLSCVRGNGYPKLKFLEISGCPPEMEKIKNGDTFDVASVRRQKIPAHKKITVYSPIGLGHPDHES